MSEFAKIENGIVTQVIVVDQDVIDSGAFGSGWIETYNIPADENTAESGRKKVHAAVGYRYDQELDEFIPPIDDSTIYDNTEGELIETPDS